MTQYVGFLRGGPSRELSPAEAQRTLERYLAWNAALTPEPGGGGLSRQGQVLKGLTATDGPYAEGAEVVGGFITIEATSLDEASKIFSDHPHLEFGTIEVRKIGEQGCED
jgi:hypothetical protein